MAKQLGKNEFELKGQSPAIFERLDRWSLELEEELNDLLRALRRKKGFSLFFVQCSPALGERIIEAIRERFPQKKLARFELDRESKTLCQELIESYQTEQFKIVCVTGIEKTLYAYEDTNRLAGWSSEDIYNYSWKGVPSLLSHLNYHRELFEANLPVALIFLVPRFAIDYFVQRAPDFFDWRSGFFKFVESSEKFQKISQDLANQTYQEYLNLAPEKRMERILQLKDEILQIDPLDCEQRSNLLREQGLLFESGGDFNQSLDCYDRSLFANSKNHKSWSSKGSLLDDLEQYKEAIVSYDHALKIKPDSFLIWHNRGNSLHHLEKYEEAIKSYGRALEIQPELFFTWHSLGDVLTKLERYEEAISSYDRALEIQPELFFTWDNRGDALTKLERHEEAISSYDRALEIKPDFFFTWNSRGDVLTKLERHEEAISSYDRALKIKPDFFFILHNRGNSFYYLERYEEAIESYDRALEIQANFFLAWHSRGDVLAELERYEEAIESYNCALEIQANFFLAWHSRGNALAELEKYEEAINSYNRVLEIQPNYYYAWNNRGNMLVELKRYEEAIESYNHTLKIKPDFHDAWRKKGYVLYLLGKHQESFNCFARVVEIKSDDYIAWNDQGYLALAKYSYGLKPISGKPLLIRQIQDCRFFKNTNKIYLEDCNKAIKLFDKALDIETKNSIVYANLSFPTYYLQQYKKALQNCDKSLKLHSENKEKFYEVVYINRGCILLKLHKFTLALQDFTIALIFAFVIDSKRLKYSDTWSEAWLGHGKALYYLGCYSEALNSFTQALELNHPFAQINIDRTKEKLANN